MDILEQLIRDTLDERAQDAPTVDVLHAPDQPASAHARRWVAFGAAAVAVAAVAVSVAIIRDRPNATDPSGSAPGELSLIIRYGIRPGVNLDVTPQLVAQLAGATTCTAWNLTPQSQGGGSLEVRVLVPADQVDDATARIRARVINATISTAGADAVSSAPPPSVVPPRGSGPGTIIRPASGGPC